MPDVLGKLIGLIIISSGVMLTGAFGHKIRLLFTARRVQRESTRQDALARTAHSKALALPQVAVVSAAPPTVIKPLLTDEAAKIIHPALSKTTLAEVAGMTGTAQRAANLTTSTNHHVAKEPPKPSSRRWIGRLKVNKPGNRVGVLMASVLTMSILGGCALTVLQEYRLHEFCSNRGSKQFERDYIVDVVRFCKPEPSSFEFSTYQSLNSANQSSLLKSLARISGLRVASNMFDLREAGERHSERGVDAARELVTSNRNDFILFCSALAAVAGLFAYIIGLFLGWAWLGAQRQT